MRFGIAFSIFIILFVNLAKPIQSNNNPKQTKQDINIIEKVDSKSVSNYKKESNSTYKIPNINTSFKAYMDYRCITDKTSSQWDIQQKAHTNKQGFRKIKNDYVVALGTYYTDKCGARFKVTLDNGFCFKIITGDIKNDRDTDSTHMFTPIKDGYGNIIEFIVDSKKMSKKVLITGDVSYLGLQGNIIKIEKLK